MSTRSSLSDVHSQALQGFREKRGICGWMSQALITIKLYGVLSLCQVLSEALPLRSELTLTTARRDGAVMPPTL